MRGLFSGAAYMGEQGNCAGGSCLSDPALIRTVVEPCFAATADLPPRCLRAWGPRGILLLPVCWLLMRGGRRSNAFAVRHRLHDSFRGINLITSTLDKGGPLELPAVHRRLIPWYTNRRSGGMLRAASREIGPICENGSELRRAGHLSESGKVHSNFGVTLPAALAWHSSRVYCLAFRSRTTGEFPAPPWMVPRAASRLRHRRCRLPYTRLSRRTGRCGQQPWSDYLTGLRDRTG